MLLYWQVTFIASKRHDKTILISRGVCFHLVDPILNRLERCLVLDVIADNCTNSISVVHVNHRSESFMTTSVPNVHLHLLLWSSWILHIWNADHFLKVGSSNSYIMHFIEAVLTEAKSN